VVVDHYPVETVDVLLLFQEGELFRENPFQGFVGDWDLEELGKKGEETTYTEHQIDIS
jgi:hypothetical protein